MSSFPSVTEETESWLGKGLAIGPVVVNPHGVSLDALGGGLLQTSPSLGTDGQPPENPDHRVIVESQGTVSTPAMRLTLLPLCSWLWVFSLAVNFYSR